MIQEVLKPLRALLLIAVLPAILLTGCDYFTEDEQEREIKIVYTEWSESVALTNLSSILLEDKMGYDVILKLTDVESAYADVASGNADIFTDAWLPVTQQVYFDKHKDNIEKLGISYPDAKTGFVVPDYSELVSIEDLKTYQKPVIGIDSGAGVMNKARTALRKNAPNVELLNLSEAEMTKKLEDAIMRRENIVVTGWEPHWVFAKYKLRFLEDKNKVFGEKESIYTISRKNLSEEHPYAARFFERMQLSEKQLNSLVLEISLAKDAKTGTQNWINKNEFVVNQWVKDLGIERDKIM